MIIIMTDFEAFIRLLCFKPRDVIRREQHLRCNYYGASLVRNSFTWDSASAAIIFTRLRWRLRHKHFSNLERTLVFNFTF